jgi:hypothetical protein
MWPGDEVEHFEHGRFKKMRLCRDSETGRWVSFRLGSLKIFALLNRRLVWLS